PEERGIGDTKKTEVFKQLHKHINPNFYLEIGVLKGKMFELANCKKLGIDPEPKTDDKNVYTMESDTFFDTNTLHDKVDIAYIDGMHLFEYVLRDFINVEKYSHKKTLIMIDDVFPAHPKQANRERDNSP
ncbi:MAG: class I SAM-dependent methyltransferase, partial [archaeon]